MTTLLLFFLPASLRPVLFKTMAEPDSVLVPESLSLYALCVCVRESVRRMGLGHACGRIRGVKRTSTFASENPADPPTGWAGQRSAQKQK